MSKIFDFSQAPIFLKMKKLTLSFLLSAVLLGATSLYAQDGKKQFLKIPIGFYNLENLFDTEDGPNDDAEFLPNGLNSWTPERYKHKLANMAKVIGDIAGTGPAILGVAEIENRQVLEDLVAEPAIAHHGYKIVHYDSPDRRGVDCGILYRPDVFQLIAEGKRKTELADNPDFLTRDVIFATGRIAGEVIHIIVAHWPSRAGGEERSLPGRKAAAATMKAVSDSLLTAYPGSKAILMGDFNDDPVSPSIREGLALKDHPTDVAYHEYFTPMVRMYNQGMGTLAYRDAWNIFDIIVVNGGLLGEDFSTFKLLKDPSTGNLAHIFKKNYMLQQTGRYKGYPLRTIVAGQYQGGYSDHLPVYIFIAKEM